MAAGRRRGQESQRRLEGECDSGGAALTASAPRPRGSTESQRGWQQKMWSTLPDDVCDL